MKRIVPVQANTGIAPPSSRLLHRRPGPLHRSAAILPGRLTGSRPRGPRQGPRLPFSVETRTYSQRQRAATRTAAHGEPITQRDSRSDTRQLPNRSYPSQILRREICRADRPIRGHCRRTVGTVRSQATRWFRVSSCCRERRKALSGTGGDHRSSVVWAGCKFPDPPNNSADRTGDPTLSVWLVP
jgi:hypothetical protein